MKRNKFFAIALTGLALVVTSCDKDDEKSDYETGKEAGAAYCDCMSKAGESDEALVKCLSFVDWAKVVDSEEEAKWTEYQKGFYEASLKCLGDED